MLLNCGVGKKLLKVPWTARRSNQSILKKINPEYSLEGRVLKLQCIGHLMRRANSLEKTLMLGKIRQEEKGMTEDEMVRWHHLLNGRGFEQALGYSEGWEGLTCSHLWCHRESDMTEQQQLFWLLFRTNGLES